MIAIDVIEDLLCTEPIVMAFSVSVSLHAGSRLILSAGMDWVCVGSHLWRVRVRKSVAFVYFLLRNVSHRSMATVFGTLHNFNQGQIGTTFVSMMYAPHLDDNPPLLLINSSRSIGTLLGFITIRFQEHLYTSVPFLPLIFVR